MIQAIYVPKERAIYAKAHIRMTNDNPDKKGTIKVFDADPFTDDRTGKEYFRMTISGDKSICKEIIDMTGDYYTPSKKLKAYASRM